MKAPQEGFDSIRFWWTMMCFFLTDRLCASSLAALLGLRHGSNPNPNPKPFKFNFKYCLCPHYLNERLLYKHKLHIKHNKLIYSTGAFCTAHVLGCFSKFQTFLSCKIVLEPLLSNCKEINSFATVMPIHSSFI